MTAAETRDVSTPPRILIRAFWALHRAAYRMTGGRFGLTRPATGQRFGMMRLTTVGRRTGQPRMAMIGYYEDGANLVTLAMNGWADADPAWWRNLQAHPETVVDLPGGRRAVRARAAAGDERERLWSRFRDYPGWGDDLDALAARRPAPTAVVVLEPAGGTGEPAGSAPAGAAPPAPIERGNPADGMAPTAGTRRFRVRHLWVLPGLAIAIHANAVAGQHELGLLPLLLFGIAPHVTALAGIGQPHDRGQLPSRAIPLFNAMHHPMAPLAVLAVAAAGLLSPFWYVGALAWLSHIVIDWALGDGLRGPDGFVRGSVPALARARVR